MLSTWPCLGPVPTVAHCTHTVPSPCSHIPVGSGHRGLRCTVLWAPSRPPGRLRLGRGPLPALLDPGQASLGGVPRALRTWSQNLSRSGKVTGGTWIRVREVLPAGAPAAWGPGVRAGLAGWAPQGQLKLSRGEAQSWRWLGTLQTKGHVQEAGCRVPWVSGAVVAQRCLEPGGHPGASAQEAGRRGRAPFLQVQELSQRPVKARPVLAGVQTWSSEVGGAMRGRPSPPGAGMCRLLFLLAVLAGRRDARLAE